MKIEHIAMYVNDLEKTKNFFEKYFNAKSNLILYVLNNSSFKNFKCRKIKQTYKIKIYNLIACIAY